VFDSASSILGRYELRELAISLGMVDWWEETWGESAMTNRTRKWCKNWIRDHNLKLDLGAPIEDERLSIATTWVIGRRFDRFEGIPSSANPRLMFNDDETMLGASLSRGKVTVALDPRVFRKKHKKPDHYTLGAGFNRTGLGPPPLIVIPTLSRAEELFIGAGCPGARVPLRGVHWPYLRCVC
jgi:hypothetical protein